MIGNANGTLTWFICSILVIIIAYSLYRLVISEYFSIRMGLKPGSINQVLLHRSAGILMFGIFPFIIVLSTTDNFTDYGLSPPGLDTYLYLILSGLIIIPVNYYNARSSRNLEMYPQIRSKIWSLQLLSLSAISWIAYLVAYEFMIRGFLLYSILPMLGLWPAIMVNTLIYSLIHFHKGYKEVVAAIPLGILLCYLTYVTGNIWTAVFAHIILALSNEWFSIYLNPSIVVKLVKR